MSAKDIVGAARREVERRFGKAADYAVIGEFELDASSERTIVIVVERTPHGRSSSRFEVAVTEFGLTQREAEVASALAERKSSDEIARALGISQHTARRHAERVLDKLGVRSRREVAEVLHRTGSDKSSRR